jgi:hypothetical protein
VSDDKIIRTAEELEMLRVFETPDFIIAWEKVEQFIDAKIAEMSNRGISETANHAHLNGYVAALCFIKGLPTKEINEKRKQYKQQLTQNTARQRAAEERALLEEEK